MLTRCLPRGAAFAFACTCLFVTCFVVYWPALGAAFIWDDDGHLTRPELATLRGLWRIWTEFGATQQYYPVLHTAFWVEHQIWGASPAAYHAINIAWHALASCLLVAVVQALRLRGAWLAGALFALHPVAVESVAWVSEQKNTLSTVFYFVAALLYVRFHDTRAIGAYRGALLCFILALGTKSVTASLPAALLVVLWWRHGRLSWRDDVRPLLPWFALGVTAGLVTAAVERFFIGAQGAEFALSPWERCLLAGRVAWFYAGKLCWPADLAFIYPRWTVHAGDIGLHGWLGATLAVLAGLWLLARRSASTHGGAARAPLAAVLIFGGTLFPVLGFLNVYPFKFSYVADHFQYVARAALLVPAAAFIARLAAHPDRTLAIAARVCAGAVPLAFAVLSWRHAANFRDDETLFRATLARNPTSYLAHHEIGLALSRDPDRRDEAIAHFEAALRLRPHSAEAHTSLGAELAEIPGRATEAIAHFRTALRLRPDYVEAHVNYANFLARLPGRLEHAVRHYREALRIRPAAVIHYNLANALAQLPDHTDEALQHFEEALRLHPDFLEARFNYAAELAGLPARRRDAIAQFQRVLRQNPEHAAAHRNLAELHAALGEEQQALQHLERAMILDTESMLTRTRNAGR